MAHVHISKNDVVNVRKKGENTSLFLFLSLCVYARIAEYDIINVFRAIQWSVCVTRNSLYTFWFSGNSHLNVFPNPLHNLANGSNHISHLHTHAHTNLVKFMYALLSKQKPVALTDCLLCVISITVESMSIDSVVVYVVEFLIEILTWSLFN